MAQLSLILGATIGGLIGLLLLVVGTLWFVQKLRLLRTVHYDRKDDGEVVQGGDVESGVPRRRLRNEYANRYEDEDGDESGDRNTREEERRREAIHRPVTGVDFFDDLEDSRPGSTRKDDNLQLPSSGFHAQIGKSIKSRQGAGTSGTRLEEVTWSDFEHDLESESDFAEAEDESAGSENGWRTPENTLMDKDLKLPTPPQFEESLLPYEDWTPVLTQHEMVDRNVSSSREGPSQSSSGQRLDEETTLRLDREGDTLEQTRPLERDGKSIDLRGIGAGLVTPEDHSQNDDQNLDIKEAELLVKSKGESPVSGPPVDDDLNVPRGNLSVVEDESIAKSPPAWILPLSERPSKRIHMPEMSFSFIPMIVAEDKDASDGEEDENASDEEEVETIPERKTPDIQDHEVWSRDFQMSMGVDEQIMDDHACSMEETSEESDSQLEVMIPAHSVSSLSTKAEDDTEEPEKISVGETDDERARMFKKPHEGRAGRDSLSTAVKPSRSESEERRRQEEVLRKANELRDDMDKFEMRMEDVGGSSQRFQIENIKEAEDFIEEVEKFINELIEPPASPPPQIHFHHSPAHTQPEVFHKPSIDFGSLGQYTYVREHHHRLPDSPRPVAFKAASEHEDDSASAERTEDKSTESPAVSVEELSDLMEVGESVSSVHDPQEPKHENERIDEIRKKRLRLSELREQRMRRTKEKIPQEHIEAVSRTSLRGLRESTAFADPVTTLVAENEIKDAIVVSQPHPENEKDGIRRAPPSDPSTREQLVDHVDNIEAKDIAGGSLINLVSAKRPQRRSSAFQKPPLIPEIRPQAISRKTDDGQDQYEAGRAYIPSYAPAALEGVHTPDKRPEGFSTPFEQSVNVSNVSPSLFTQSYSPVRLPKGSAFYFVDPQEVEYKPNPVINRTLVDAKEPELESGAEPLPYSPPSGTLGIEPSTSSAPTAGDPWVGNRPMISSDMDVDMQKEFELLTSLSNSTTPERSLMSESSVDGQSPETPADIDMPDREPYIVGCIQPHLEDTKETFMCEECGIPFHTLGLKNKHTNRKHIRRYTCKISTCGASFHLNADLQRHRQTVHKDVFKCKEWKCTKSFCKTPSAVFRRKDNFERHLARCAKSAGSVR